MNASWVWWGIGVYVLITLAIAYGSRRQMIGGLSDYFLGNRTLGGFVSALSYSATTYSAFMLVGLAGLTYKGGVGALGFELIYFSGIVLVAFFGPRFWLVGKEYNYITPSDLLSDRYQSRAVGVTTALASCVFLIPYSAVQLAGVGYLLSGMTGNAISFTAGTLVAVAIALLFTLIAGLRSVAWTDAVQALIMIVTSTAIVAIVVYRFGGLGVLFDTVSAGHPGWLSVPGNGFFSFTTFLGLTLPWFFFSLSNPQVSQRLFMPSSMTSLRRMLIGFMGFGFIYTLVSVLWGFSALTQFPDLKTPDLASPTLLSSVYVPPLLGLIVMVGILAAAVSTIDSILLTLASLVARNVYGAAQRKPDEVRQLWVGKLVIPVIAVLALYFAGLQLNLIAVLSVASSAGLLVTVPAIIGAFFWKKGTAAGVLSSVIIGGALVVYLELTRTKWLGLSSGIWGFVISIILFVGVSWLTRRKVPKEKAEAFMGYVRSALQSKGAI